MGTTFPHQFQGQTEGDYPFIKVADFANADPGGRLRTATNWISRSVAQKLGARIVPPGTVLYARVGAAMLLNQRRLTTSPCVVDDNVRGFHPRTGDPRYWMYLLSLLDLGRLSNPGPVPSVSESQIASVKVPFPPVDEQREIGNWLDERVSIYETARRQIDSQLAVLSERKQALITAAVSGQFDVATGRMIPL